MDKFRILSDLHIDYNKEFPFKLTDKDIFTVICGDTSGTPSDTIKWIRENVRCGVGVSGNHLPYNDLGRTMRELRSELAGAFPLNADFTYFDCETGTFSKVVDGILFIGTCMYTDMHIKHPEWNPTGSKELNMKCSEFNMNDYYYGHVEDQPSGTRRMRAKDYFGWFVNAFNLIEKRLCDNEESANPLPVVLITHHPLITDFIANSWYVESYFNCQREFNWASYASDQQHWIMRHPSVKCYCCGHIHAVAKPFRQFKLKRPDGSYVLVVNNCRGYLDRGHDTGFNPNTFVNVRTWDTEELPLTADEISAREERAVKRRKNLAWLI